MIVVDASVAVKWLILEDGSTAATDVYRRDARRLHAPDLILVEVSGAIARLARTGHLPAEAARAVVRRWTALPAPHIHPVSRDLSAAAADLSIALRHPIQDCVYLALADELGATLLTADRRFHDRVAAAHPNVTLLAHP